MSTNNIRCMFNAFNKMSLTPDSSESLLKALEKVIGHHVITLEMIPLPRCP